VAEPRHFQRGQGETPKREGGAGGQKKVPAGKRGKGKTNEARRKAPTARSTNPRRRT
jgi:hypothetical protein